MHDLYRLSAQMLQTLQQSTSTVGANPTSGGAHMAFWKRKCDEFEQTLRLIEENPGIQPAELARLLGVSRSTIIRRLPSLEDAGHLLYEDDRGGLYRYQKD